MKKLLLIILCACLTACATMPAKQGPLNHRMSWQARQKQVQPIQHWTINGAMGITMPNYSQAASMVWQQQVRDYQISLFGPFGVGRTTLAGSPTGVTLLVAGKQYQAKTAESLMQQVLGWQLPVTNLYYWVRGIPAPNSQAIKSFDAYHHLTELKQPGWQILYQRYTAIKGIDLPSKILLKRGQLQVKFVIASWKLPHN